MRPTLLIGYRSAVGLYLYVCGIAVLKLVLTLEVRPLTQCCTPRAKGSSSLSSPRDVLPKDSRDSLHLFYIDNYEHRVNNQSTTHIPRHNLLHCISSFFHIFYCLLHSQCDTQAPGQVLSLLPILSRN
ncbi:hypothetical protein DM02DRAFT_440365 [Periconia macrospinosa]|uniref:Uncharacterized protein n=1 Tax=Periconia macrospinosa TaxID=97972 RepID=A0A2V1CXK8_9PLEO|nr:hypothetical protein DM02DRAFT_440365 [Periconia macrospinosa]